MFMKFKKLQQYLFLTFLVLITVAFLWIVDGFLTSIFWATVLAIIFSPIHQRWLSATNDRASLSSSLTILSIIAVVFIPLFLVGTAVFSESVNLYQRVSVIDSSSSISTKIFDGFDTVKIYLDKVGFDEKQVEEKFGEFAEKSTSWLSDQAISLGQNTFSIVLKLFVMFYILFFLLRDGKQIKKRFIEIMPFGDKKEKRLLEKFSSTTRAVIKGTFVVGIVQGGIGAILFFIAGIDGALLWGVLMMILSVIPALGASIIWLPASIILLLTGNVWEGVMIIIGGILIISLIDNILKPILVGKDTQMPDAIILISTLGGLSVFGITGFVIGPIIAGFFISMWEMFEEEYKKELETQG